MLRARQDFLADNTLRSRARSTTPEIWERMGTTMEEVLPSLMEAVQKRQTNQFAGFQAGFFAKYLKGKGTFDIDEVLTFQTGTNTWVKASHWPPKESTTPVWLPLASRV